jgi:hypothetical protein
MEATMEVTREDAQESLAAVEAMMQKVRRAVADGGTHYFLIPGFAVPSR